MTLRRGVEDAGICRRRVQPMLFDLATHRLRRQHGVELIEDPERARELLGDETFQFLTERRHGHRSRPAELSAS